MADESVDAAVTMPAWEVALRILLSAVLLAFSALFSGLTLGVMGLDTTSLTIIMESGDPADRARAQSIMRVRKDGNLLLCTLLLGNVAVNSLLAILTAELTSGIVGFILSTLLIVLLGEIFPQAACSRHGLRVGAKFVPVVRVVIFALWLFAKPVALVLDWWLGAEVGTYFSRSELSTLVRLHATRKLLSPGEAAAMTGALSFRNKKVRTVMTPISQVFAVLASDRLDYATITSIFRTGFSRVPVWADERRSDVVGMLYAKDLMLLSPTAGVPVLAVVHFFARQRVNVVDEEDDLGTILQLFSSTRQQIAVVRTVEQHDEFDPTYKISGIVTLEDVVEELLGQEIEDEYDREQRRLESSAAATAAAERAAREQAALDTMNVVLHLPPAPGRGVNNALSSAEVRSIAAHLLRVVPAFRHHDGTERFTYAAVGELVAMSSVLQFVALLPTAAAREEEVSQRQRQVASEASPSSSVSPIAQVLPHIAARRSVDASGTGLDSTTGPSPDDTSIAVAPTGSDAYEQPSAALMRARPIVRRAPSAMVDEGDPTFRRLASGVEHAAAVLVARGEPTGRCLLILHGHVRCICGNDSVTADKGPWDIIAEKALQHLPDGASPAAGVTGDATAPYVPDFSAFALTSSVRCLSIERTDVIRICSGGASASGGSGPHSSSPAVASEGNPPQPAPRSPVPPCAVAPRPTASNDTGVAIQVGAPLSAAKGTPLMDRVHLLTEVDLRDVPDLGTLLPSPSPPLPH